MILCYESAGKLIQEFHHLLTLSYQLNKNPERFLHLQNVEISKQELIILSGKITLIDWERKTRQNYSVFLAYDRMFT